MLVFIQYGRHTELEENVVEHAGLLPGGAFRDMGPVSGKPLEGRILCAPPWSSMDVPNPCGISNDERINAIVLIKGVKIFLVLLYLIGVETADLCGKRGQLFGGGEVISDMDTIKASGFQSNNNGFEFMVLGKHLCSHLILFSAPPCALATGTILIRKSWSKLGVETMFARKPMSMSTKSVDR